ncbi:MAG: DnaA/Hda family protein, partial [Pirellulaceae bacterium]|nr:DnaA/Hda family protein [Pirellulaceae bacterium]
MVALLFYEPLEERPVHQGRGHLQEHQDDLIFFNKGGQEVTKDNTEIVSAVHEALADRVGQERYNVWFKNQTTIASTADGLEIETKNRFDLDRVRRTFRKDLLSIAQYLIHPQADVAFRLKETEPPADAEPTNVQINGQQSKALNVEANSSEKEGLLSTQSEDKKTAEILAQLANLKENPAPATPQKLALEKLLAQVSEVSTPSTSEKSSTKTSSGKEKEETSTEGDVPKLAPTTKLAPIKRQLQGRGREEREAKKSTLAPKSTPKAGEQKRHTSPNDHSSASLQGTSQTQKGREKASHSKPQNEKVKPKANLGDQGEASPFDSQLILFDREEYKTEAQLRREAKEATAAQEEAKRQKEAGRKKRSGTRNHSEVKQSKTLQNFVCGKENRLVQTSIEVVADELGSVSPLFIHGATGTGKSHLVQGLVHLV